MTKEEDDAALLYDLELGSRLCQHAAERIRELKVACEAITAERDTWKGEAEAQRAIAEDGRQHHHACLVELYKLLDIDGADGEYRFKWVSIELSRRKAQFANHRGSAPPPTSPRFEA